MKYRSGNIHIPVLLDRSIDYLNVKPDGIYVDATFGEGGHTKKIIEKLSDTGIVIGIDCDKKAIENARIKFKDEKRLKLVNGNFKDIGKILKNMNIQGVNGVLFDLGISSMQLEDAERGFSFIKDGPLDMRMDINLIITAFDVINNYSERELRDIFYKYGEEKYASRVAREIVKYRLKNVIKTTLQLSNIIKRVIPNYGKIHPSTRIFQALRIFVNSELENLLYVMKDIWSYIKEGGRVVVISFHSLEDRIVKNEFKNAEINGICEILTRKPVIPDSFEIKNNPRARSAKMRVAIRV